MLMRRPGQRVPAIVMMAHLKVKLQLRAVVFENRNRAERRSGVAFRPSDDESTGRDTAVCWVVAEEVRAVNVRFLRPDAPPLHQISVR
ncbi:MAG: hypothetical protein ABR508_08135 [Candidatus Baltobacteraceae bacterium]